MCLEKLVYFEVVLQDISTGVSEVLAFLRISSSKMFRGRKVEENSGRFGGAASKEIWRRSLQFWSITILAQEQLVLQIWYYMGAKSGITMMGENMVLL